MIWNFDDAPERVRKMHRAAESASWVAFIPHQIHAADVDQAIKSRLGSEWALRYEINDGDIVYCGYGANQIGELMAAMTTTVRLC